MAKQVEHEMEHCGFTMKLKSETLNPIYHRHVGLRVQG